MLKKNKLLAGIAATVMMLSACAVSASAATLTASLSAADSVKYSAKASNLYGSGTMSGTNQSYSAGNVLFIAKYQSGLIWYQSQNVDVPKGQSFSVPNPSQSSKRTWQLGLNPKGGNAYGCTANGTLQINS